jgi:hypothetical protein
MPINIDDNGKFILLKDNELLKNVNSSASWI